MRHLWSLVCLSSAIDSDTNQLSIFNVIEEINAQVIPDGLESDAKNIKGMPNSGIRYHLVTIWALEPNEQSYFGTQKVIVESPESEILSENEVIIDMRQHRRFRNRIVFSGFPIRNSGEYIFRISHRPESTDEWIEVDTVPLQVHVEIVETEEDSEPSE